MEIIAQRAFISAEKVFAIPNMEGLVIEDADHVKRQNGVVKFDNVTFAYKAGENVLQQISFEARRGRL